MGNLVSEFEHCGADRKPAAPAKRLAIKDAPNSYTAHSPSKDLQNPQQDSPVRQQYRSSMELLDVLTDSAFKTKSMRFANLDDAYAKDLITDEEYASRMLDLNLSTSSASGGGGKDESMLSASKLYAAHLAQAAAAEEEEEVTAA